MRPAAGARRGLDMWLWQRASAVYLLLALLALLCWALLQPALDYAAWYGLFRADAVKVAALVAVLAAVLHAWIGVREIAIDYLPVLRLRLALYFLTGAGYAACLVWAADILWGVR